VTALVDSVVDSDILVYLELLTLHVDLCMRHLLSNYLERRVGEGLVGEDGIGAAGEA
jgi:hypothetical protein